VTAVEEMRIENEALHEGMEHLTKKYDELKVSLRRKCGAQGIKELEAGGLLQTQLDVCQADLLRVRSERSQCLGETEKVDRDNMQLQENVKKARRDKKNFFEKADYLVSRLEKRTNAQVAKSAALAAALNQTMREEQTILSRMLKSNGAPLRTTSLPPALHSRASSACALWS
jgi:hypothetical protein